MYSRDIFTDIHCDIVKMLKTRATKMLSTDEWIKKMWYVYTIEYYSDIKRNNIGPFIETCVNLESIIQCEVDQKE